MPTRRLTVRFWQCCWKERRRTGGWRRYEGKGLSLMLPGWNVWLKSSFSWSGRGRLSLTSYTGEKQESVNSDFYREGFLFLLKYMSMYLFHFREEAQHVWEKREAEWERERKARERLMHEVNSKDTWIEIWLKWFDWWVTAFLYFPWKGACSKAATAGAKDAKEPWGSGGIPEETWRADQGAGAGERHQTARESAWRGP